jgi:FkbM family methyltransferase
MAHFLERAVMGLCGVLPRGGFKIAHAARQVLPGLANYPAQLRFGNVVLKGDVAHNVFYPLVRHGYYTHQAVEDDVLAYLARGSRLIVDVGGNIGYTAALLAASAPDARIFVFEPLPLCKPYLDQIAAQFPGVTIAAKAVGATPGTAQFLQRAQIDRSSLKGGEDARIDPTQTASAQDEHIKVEVTTLDAEFAGQIVDVIKIDVEGFEHDVLMGARTTIARCKPVVVFEAYETVVLAAAISIFAEIDPGYMIYTIAHDGHLRSFTKAERQADENCNFVAWPPGRKPPPNSAVPQFYARPV